MKFNTLVIGQKCLMQHLRFSSLVLLLPIGTSVAAEISQPDGVTEWIELSPVSPIPQYCAPKKPDANIFVLSNEGILPVFVSDGVADFNGYFDVSGFFLFDANDSGKPEAYGFGTARSNMGGGFPSNLWTNNDGEQIDFRTGEFSGNFARGLPLDGSYEGDGLPTLVINLSDWSCWVTAYPNGDVAAST